VNRQIVVLAVSSAILAMVSAPLAAQDLAGDWQFKRLARNGYHTGTIVIDKNGQARMSGRSPLQNYSQSGHVTIAGDKVEIVFTSVKSTLGYSADRFYCTVRCEDVLRCFNVDGYGKEDDLFRVERMGRAPPPAGQKDDDCPVRERPQV
jgi:hypothetical protein